MTTTEKICYLKNNELYTIENGSLIPITLEEIETFKGKINLLLDDNFFFYVGMDHVSITGKKLRAVAKNYLNVIFPSNLTSNYGVFQGNGYTFIYIISDELMSLIDEYPNLFSLARKITTPFTELSSRYNEFIYSDKIKTYKKDNNTIISTDETPTITFTDLISDISSIKTNISLPNVSKLPFNKMPFLIPAATISLVYLIFLIGSIISLNSISNVDKYYNEKLDEIYKSVGINNTNDPYGQLLFKSGRANKDFDGKKILEIISDLEKISKDTAIFETFSVRDKSVRIEGFTDDFAKAENLKKKAEQFLQVSVNMDDTKKTDKGVTFVMRYEQK